MRLDRALSKLGVASRAEAKQLIANGRVRVAGRIVRNAAHLVTPEQADITVDNAKPTRRAWRTLAFHKPRGVVTTRRDPEGRPTVFDVLGDEAGTLIAVGRLDMASTGLLILTTDTRLANDLTDPSNAIVRRYIVTVRGALDDAEAKQMTAGIDGLRATSVLIRKRSFRETHLIVELVEGKNREIRRMLESLGHPVTKLMRVAFGGVELGKLQPGEWRDVSLEEVTEGTEFTAKKRSERRRKGTMFRMKRGSALAVLLSVGFVATNGCRREATTVQAPAPAQLPLSSMPKIDANKILDHIRVLSSDEYEGRKPGSKGEELTVKYLDEQFRQLNLKPGNPDGTYVQKVPLVGITAAEVRPLTFTKATQKQTVKWADQVVAWTKHVADGASIDNTDVIFAGYGVEAPEYKWDDFKDVDVKGKTILVLVNDPAVPDPSDPNKLDPNTFKGDAMTYYGRWTYKFEEGARKGAAAVLIVHEEKPAGYPFKVVQGNLDEKFDLVTADKNMSRVNIEGWITTDTAKKILTMGGQDFDTLKKQARTREFRPVPLGLKASMAIKNKLRTIDSQNVLAKLEGSDQQLKDEYVVYSAHWDHLGIGAPDKKGDKIYNGALDNASGVATVLEIARAFSQVQPQPKRSILFLMVTAEEQGLLGSQYYATNPLYPLNRTLANVNIDGVNQWGHTKDLTVVGMGASDLDDYLKTAADEQGRVLRPDPEPEKGFYYRSDHFNFAKQGVPALDPDSGIDFVGKDAAYGKAKRDEYTDIDYHQPSDEIKPDWDLSGAVDDAQLFLAVGYRVANASNPPEWKPGNEFKAKREESLKK